MARGARARAEGERLALAAGTSPRIRLSRVPPALHSCHMPQEDAAPPARFQERWLDACRSDALPMGSKTCDALRLHACFPGSRSGSATGAADDSEAVSCCEPRLLSPLTDAGGREADERAVLEPGEAAAKVVTSAANLGWGPADV
eukprot:scaffold7308_cov114-Isochrysis_galbana.AAC.14